MDIKLLSGALGAEVDGINLKDSSDKNFKIINDLLLEHKVIFFRNQSITTEEHKALARKFGPLENHAYVKGRENHPEIVRIIKDPNEKNQWGENWHSDVSYNIKPTKAVILRSIKIPPVGGDTVFSNMQLAFETLDKNIKEKISDKKAVHSSLGAAFFVKDYKAMEGNGNIDEYSNTHPIVRTHPETGKKILYVNWTYTKQIVGFDKLESDELLKKILHSGLDVNFPGGILPRSNPLCSPSPYFGHTLHFPSFSSSTMLIFRKKLSGIIFVNLIHITLM